VHHRVKNNLQATASLINLHIRRSKQADVSELGALRDRITAMSQAHEQLQEVSSTPFSTKTLIANLCELHRTAYHREGVRCRVVGDDLTVPFEAATSLSLILNEAVSNALKHGFGVGERGIVVACVSVGSGGAVIRIRDNGRGIAAETDNSGIGMTLIHSLAVQVNGTAELKRRRGRGSEFVLTLDGAFGHDSVDVAPSVGRRPASPIAAPESTVA
jgi:two-component sensor histidine kinase